MVKRDNNETEKYRLLYKADRSVDGGKEVWFREREIEGHGPWSDDRTLSSPRYTAHSMTSRPRDQGPGTGTHAVRLVRVERRDCGRKRS